MTDSTNANNLARLDQLPIQPGRRNFQRVRPRHHIFYIEDRAKLAAEVRTVFVRDPGQWIRPRRGLVEKYSQHARLTSAEELDIHDFEPAGGGHPLRDFPHTFNVKRHESSNLRAMAATPEGPN